MKLRFATAVSALLIAASVLAQETRVDDPRSDIGLGDCRESPARRTLEVGEFQNFHGGISLAHHVTLGRTGVGHVDLNRLRCDWLRLRFARGSVGQ